MHPDHSASDRGVLGLSGERVGLLSAIQLNGEVAHNGLLAGDYVTTSDLLAAIVDILQRSSNHLHQQTQDIFFFQRRVFCARVCFSLVRFFRRSMV